MDALKSPSEKIDRPVLQRYTDELTNELYELDQNVKDLLSQIEPILSQEIEGERGEDSESIPPVSDLSRFVIEKTHFVRELNAVIHRVRRRIEV